MNKTDAIRTYIEGEMPGYELTVLPARSVRPFGFRLERDGNEYIVEFEEQFVEERDAAEIVKAMEEWNVLAEMCRGEGLRYVMTPRGLRLDSSN